MISVRETSVDGSDGCKDIKILILKEEKDPNKKVKMNFLHFTAFILDVYSIRWA